MLRLTYTYNGKGVRPKLVVFFNKSSESSDTHQIAPGTPTEISIPERASYIVFQGVAAYDSTYGQVANVLEGKAFTKADGENGTVTLHNRIHQGELTGTVQFEYTKKPAKRARYPSVVAVGDTYCAGHKSEMINLYERNRLWHNDGRVRPATPIVGRIHSTRFNRMFLPGWTFMLDCHPMLSDIEVFDNAIRSILVRRNYTGDVSQESEQHKAIIAAEAVQAIANMIHYTTDYEYTPGNPNGREEYDEFISSARNDYLRAGDCEDLAKEMHMLIRELQQRTWPPSSLTGQVADALKHYISGIVLGSMMAPKAGMADLAPTGHAYLALFPKYQFSKRLDPSVELVDTDMSRLEPGFSLLILDGTNLKPVEFRDIMFPQPAVHSTSALKSEVFRKARISMGELRVRTYIPKLSYIHCVSIMVNDVVTRASGDESKMPVYQLYMKHGKEYGVEFEHIDQADVSIVPCMIPTRQDLELCRMGIELEPPIQGYKAPPKQPAPRPVTVKPWTDPASQPLQLFIQAIDRKITETIIKNRDLFDGVYVHPETFATQSDGDNVIVLL